MAFRFTPAASLRYAQAISEGRILGISGRWQFNESPIDRYRTLARLSFLIATGGREYGTVTALNIKCVNMTELCSTV
jgi:hypothetical protein